MTDESGFIERRSGEDRRRTPRYAAGVSPNMYLVWCNAMHWPGERRKPRPVNDGSMAPMSWTPRSRPA